MGNQEIRCNKNDCSNFTCWLLISTKNMFFSARSPVFSSVLADKQKQSSRKSFKAPKSLSFRNVGHIHIIWKVYTFTYVYYVSGTEGTVPKYNEKNSYSSKPLRLRKGHRSHIHYLSSRAINKWWSMIKSSQPQTMYTLSSGATNISTLVGVLP